MSSAKIVFSLFFLINLCSGCSKFSIDGTEATSITLNATERLVLAANHAGTDHQSFVVCAEPSPDALKGVDFLIALNGDGPGGNSNLGIASSYNETLAQLGKRTSTIQLLRDALYRACEAHLNGMLSKEQYRELLYGYDDLVLTLLAIEGITQTAGSKPMTKEIAEEVRLILVEYYKLQKFLYENCLVSACTERHAKNSFGKTPNYIKETRESHTWNPIEE